MKLQIHHLNLGWSSKFVLVSLVTLVKVVCGKTNFLPLKQHLKYKAAFILPAITEFDTQSFTFPDYIQTPCHLVYRRSPPKPETLTNVKWNIMSFRHTFNLPPGLNELSSPRTRNVNLIHCNANSKAAQPRMAWQMNVSGLNPLSKHWQAQRKHALFSSHHSGLRISFYTDTDRETNVLQSFGILNT